MNFSYRFSLHITANVFPIGLRLFAWSGLVTHRGARLLALARIQCQRHGKDPHAYMKDVLTRLPAMSNQDDLTPLLPVNWTPAQIPHSAS